MRASVWLVGVVRSSSSTTFCGWSVLRILRPVKSPAMRLAALPTLPQTWRALACSVCSGVRVPVLEWQPAGPSQTSSHWALLREKSYSWTRNWIWGQGVSRALLLHAFGGAFRRGLQGGGFRGRIQGALTSRLLLSMR